MHSEECVSSPASQAATHSMPPPPHPAHTGLKIGPYVTDWSKRLVFASGLTKNFCKLGQEASMGSLRRGGMGLAAVRNLPKICWFCFNLVRCR